MDYTSRPRRHRSGSVLLALVLLPAGCLLPPPEPPPRPSVILILVDTLRADHLGAYGYERSTSRHFDALATSSYLFEQTRAQAPCTFPSANSILTGRYPERFKGQPDRRMGIPETIPSLAEILGNAGYRTAAISASPIVRVTPTRFNPHGGFGRGFQRFDERCLWKDADCVNGQAARVLDGLSQPFFLYLHYMDPHGPYRPPPEWPRRFVPQPEEGPEAEPGVSPAAARGDPRPIARALYRDGDASLATPADLARLRDLYDEEIAFFDSRLGKLVVDLRRRGLLDRSILVVLADHGEEFFEHRHMKHCHTLFDTEIRTPLLVRLPPGLEPRPPRRISTQVANLDVVPTILDYLQVPADDLGLEGRSLRPLVAGETDEGPPVLAAWGGSLAVVDRPFKLVYRVERRESRLYSLELDPGEIHDLAAEHPHEARALLRELREWYRTLEASGQGPAGDDTVERLRSLGYLE